MTGRPSWGGYFSKLPHGYFDWAPVLEAGDAAALMLLKMSDYAARNRTDGRLSARQVATIGTPKGRRRDLARLSECRLIEPDGESGGWVIVGWLDGHRTAEQIADIGRKRSSAGQVSARVRAARAAGSPPSGEQVVEQHAEQVAGHLFVPDTETETDADAESSSSSVTSRAASPAASDEEEDDSDLPTRMWRAAGITAAPSSTDRGHVVAKLNGGLTPAELMAMADQASTAERPLSYLRTCLSNPPRAKVASNGRWPDPPRGLLDSEKPKCDVEGCDSGWLKRFEPDGFTPVTPPPPCPKCRPGWQ